MNPPTDEELLLWLKNTENAFVERKVSSDAKDWLKTVVAFANSTPVDYPAVLYIGVKDDGTPEQKSPNLDSLQKTLAEKLRLAYPRIYYMTRILRVEGHQLLAVIVPGSSSRPHFAGPAYVRDGSVTVEASKEQFDSLIAMRNSKAYEILKWKGKTVSTGQVRKGDHRPFAFGHATVIDCNQFYVTLDAPGLYFLHLERLELSYDAQAKRLALIECPA